MTALSKSDAEWDRTPLGGLMADAQWQLNVCDACRYCEDYCAVFPAITRRSESARADGGFTEADISHLANVCHDCGDCLDACQYAPPHEFGVNIPRLLSEVRLTTYYGERATAPVRSRQRTVALGFLLAVAMIVLLGLISEGTRVWFASRTGAQSPYRVISYGLLLVAEGSPFVVAVALALGHGARYWRHTRGPLRDLLSVRAWWNAGVEAASLRYLKGGGAGCNYPDDRPSSARRHLHHLVAYGFLACVVSTTSAAFQQDVLGLWPPYPYVSVPVISGIGGGIAMGIGCLGLMILKTRVGDERVDEPMRLRDCAFLAALFILAVSGLAVLFTRTTGAYAPVLMFHLGAVAVSFAAAAYSKFAHVLYRTLALVQDNVERLEAVAAP